MIKTKMDERFKQAKEYKISAKVLNNNTKEDFADLFYAEEENYSLLYSLLEDIEFAIYHKECKEVGEIRDFIRRYKDFYVYPRTNATLDE